LLHSKNLVRVSCWFQKTKLPYPLARNSNDFFKIIFKSFAKQGF
jgi:hypothetical protein